MKSLQTDRIYRIPILHCSARYESNEDSVKYARNFIVTRFVFKVLYAENKK